jgi:hypothetical protein
VQTAKLIRRQREKLISTPLGKQMLVPERTTDRGRIGAGGANNQLFGRNHQAGRPVTP